VTSASRSKKPEPLQEAPVIRFGDASIAAPFTSRHTSVQSIRAIICQGRCTLVTTLQMFKILAVNCLVSAYSMSTLYLYGVKSGDQQMTLVGLCTAGFFLLISRSKPLPKLSSQRPPASVFAPSIVFSVLSQFAVHLACLLLAMQAAKPFVDHDAPGMQPDADFEPNVVNTVVFVVGLAMQVSSFAANYQGRPFMESLRSNKYLFRMILGVYVILAVCLTDCFEPLNDMLQLTPFPSEDLRLQIAGLVVADTALVLAIDFVARAAQARS